MKQSANIGEILADADTHWYDFIIGLYLNIYTSCENELKHWIYKWNYDPYTEI